MLIFYRVVVDSGEHRKLEQRPPLRDIRAQMKNMRSGRDSAGSHLAVENLDQVHLGRTEQPPSIDTASPVTQRGGMEVKRPLLANGMFEGIVVDRMRALLPRVNQQSEQNEQGPRTRPAIVGQREQV